MIDHVVLIECSYVCLMIIDYGAIAGGGEETTCIHKTWQTCSHGLFPFHLFYKHCTSKR